MGVDGKEVQIGCSNEQGAFHMRFYVLHAKAEGNRYGVVLFLESFANRLQPNRSGGVIRWEDPLGQISSEVPSKEGRVARDSAGQLPEKINLCFQNLSVCVEALGFVEADFAQGEDRTGPFNSGSQEHPGWKPVQSICIAGKESGHHV